MGPLRLTHPTRSIKGKVMLTRLTTWVLLNILVTCSLSCTPSSGGGTVYFYTSSNGDHLDESKLVVDVWFTPTRHSKVIGSKHQLITAIINLPEGFGVEGSQRTLFQPWRVQISYNLVNASGHKLLVDIEVDGREMTLLADGTRYRLDPQYTSVFVFNLDATGSLELTSTESTLP